MGFVNGFGFSGSLKGDFMFSRDFWGVCGLSRGCQGGLEFADFSWDNFTFISGL